MRGSAAEGAAARGAGVGGGGGGIALMGGFNINTIRYMGDVSGGAVSASRD